MVLVIDAHAALNLFYVLLSAVMYQRTYSITIFILSLNTTYLRIVASIVFFLVLKWSNERLSM